MILHVNKTKIINFLGEDPMCNGFFYSCGFNSAGIMLGGGCGKQIADWVINGRPKKYLFSYDVRRYLNNFEKLI